MNTANSTPIRAIRAHCLQCSNGSAAEVRACVIPDCTLYPYRMGHNPNIKKREATPAQLEALRKAHDSQKIPLRNDDSAHPSRSEGKYTPESGNEKRPIETGVKRSD